MPGCDRPRSQQRPHGQAVRIFSAAGIIEHCCARGRAHSAGAAGVRPSPVAATSARASRSDPLRRAYYGASLCPVTGTLRWRCRGATVLGRSNVRTGKPFGSSQTRVLWGVTVPDDGYTPMTLPECDRPRSQQRPHGQAVRIFSDARMYGASLCPGTGTLRWRCRGATVPGRSNAHTREGSELSQERALSLGRAVQSLTSAGIIAGCCAR